MAAVLSSNDTGTVGVKILVGVALASNLFIGALLYVNLQSSATVEQKVNEVLAIKDDLSSNLRAAIVKLQDEFLEAKELSLKTEKATDDVLNKVDAIEEARSALLEHLEDIDRRMQSLNQRTGNISRVVVDQLTVTDKIAILAGRTSENTRTVSLRIAEVSDAADKTHNPADQVHEFSSEISTQLTNLLQNTTTRLEQLAHFSTPEIQPGAGV